jgi:hypothetical protein
MSDTKPTNPKDMIGSGKIPLGLVPDTIDVDVSMAFLEGALKYGRYNWRIAGVRASIYREAMHRHMMKWWNGQNKDPKTQVKHLASVIACAGILLDAELCGKLEDDRPPAAPIDRLIDGLEKPVAHLKEVFKDHNPKQYTIKDGDTYFKSEKIVWCQESTPHNDSPRAKEQFDYGAHAASDALTDVHVPTVSQFEDSSCSAGYASSPEKFVKEEWIHGHLCQWINEYSGLVNGERMDGTEFWSRVDLHRKGFNTPDEMIQAIKNGAYILEKDAT